MEDKLRRYIETLFEDATPTKKAVELREEMLQNLEDKYRDLLADGKTPEAAFNIAVAGIGDVSVLLRQLEDDAASGPEQEKQEKARRKSAMLTAIAVMMYILSIFPVITFELIGIPMEFAIPVLIFMVAVATGLLVYNNMTKPKYLKESDTMVEDFREWQADKHSGKQMRSAISSALWTLILVLYFIISFTTRAWHVSWIIFVIGGFVESLLGIFFTWRKKDGDHNE
ncbi:MAG: permease prefix domain 1-containing protein [Oscillospiraceae bacterium]|nr:permease prefix domain 1-containing protein [Oscillospiraceae bacterium]